MFACLPACLWGAILDTSNRFASPVPLICVCVGVGVAGALGRKVVDECVRRPGAFTSALAMLGEGDGILSACAMGLLRTMCLAKCVRGPVVVSLVPAYLLMCWSSLSKCCFVGHRVALRLCCLPPPLVVAIDRSLVPAMPVCLAFVHCCVRSLDAMFAQGVLVAAVALCDAHAVSSLPFALGLHIVLAAGYSLVSEVRGRLVW